MRILYITFRYMVALAVSLRNVSWAAPRESEVTSAIQELSAVLRGLRSDITSNFERLLSDLHQDRLARTELSLSLRDQVEENRLSIEMLRNQVVSMAKGSGCPANMESLSPEGGRNIGISEGIGGGTEGGGGEGGGVGGGASSGLNIIGGGRGRSNDGRTFENSHYRGSEAAAHQDEDEAIEQSSPGTKNKPKECPAPFQRAGKHCLILLKERTPWETARVQCHNYVLMQAFRLGRSSQVNGDLVVPHDMEAFMEFVKHADFSGMAWVGASTEGWGGVWAWLDGSLIKELPWLYTDEGLSGGLLAVDKNLTFHTVQHRQTLFPICELT